MMAIEVFNRYEYKFMLTSEKMREMLEVIDLHMSMDKYCKNHQTYTIANVYYDTADSNLIRKSVDQLEKPVYKEKLRMRSYGVPGKDAFVFLEIKKKFNRLVNKRRTTLKLKEAYRFCRTGEIPEKQEYMNYQVCKELEYFINHYKLKPAVYIAYDRLAYFEDGNPDLRISFDTRIRSRRTDLSLEAGDYGDLLLPENIWLMEVKTSKAMPLWLCDIITKLGLKRKSFSKYGTDFRNMISA